MTCRRRCLPVHWELTSIGLVLLWPNWRVGHWREGSRQAPQPVCPCLHSLDYLSQYHRPHHPHFLIVSAHSVAGASRSTGRCCFSRITLLASIDGRLCLGLRFQLRVMFCQKRSNFIGHGQQRDPLLLIERDGKATEAIHRHPPFALTLRLTVRPRSRFRRAFSALSRSSSACRLSSTMEGSSIRVIVRGVTSGRVTRLYPGQHSLIPEGIDKIARAVPDAVARASGR